LSAAFSSSVFSGGASVSGVDDDINRDVDIVVAVDGMKANGATTWHVASSRTFTFRALVVVRKAVVRAAARTAGAANFLPKDITGVGFCNAVNRRIATTRVKLHFVVNGGNVFIEGICDGI
jgi:hypothetical protein